MEAQYDATWAALDFDRRQDKRKAFRASALLRLPDHKVVEARTINISTGGICLVTPWNLKLDSTCDVRVRPPIRLEGLDVMLLRGRIIYSVLSGKERGFMIGLEFTEISSDVMKVVEQYLGSRTW